MSTQFDRPTLPAIGWVQDLSDDDRDLLASYGEFLGVQPDHDMVRQGDSQVHVYLVISGRLEVRRQGLQDDLVVGIIETGGSVGEVTMFDEGTASASVRALEFSQIWRIDYQSLLQFLGDSPVAGNKLMLGLAHILAQRVRRLNSQLVDARTPPHA